MEFKNNLIEFNSDELWDLDYALAPIIHSALVQYRKVAEESGICGDLSDIDEMIWCFDLSNEPVSTDYDFTIEMVEDGNGYKALKSSNPEESKRYHDDQFAWEDRIQKGHKLFGEKYRSLWI